MSDEREDETPLDTAGLAREEAPPAHLEERVVAALRGERLLGRGRPALPWAGLLRLAAAAALGIGIGLLWARPAPQQDHLVLFLRAAPSGTEGDEAGRAREYGDWARSLRRRGVPIRGEKLADEVQAFGPPGPAADPVAGYFVLGVSDLAEARAVAESCPHLRHGGRVELRRIETR